MAIRSSWNSELTSRVGFLTHPIQNSLYAAREWVQHSANASGDVDVAGTFGGKFENCWPRGGACHRRRYTQLLSSTSLSSSSSSVVVVRRSCGVFTRRRRRFIAGWVLLGEWGEWGWRGGKGAGRATLAFCCCCSRQCFAYCLCHHTHIYRVDQNRDE